MLTRLISSLGCATTSPASVTQSTPAQRGTEDTQAQPSKHPSKAVQTSQDAAQGPQPLGPKPVSAAATSAPQAPVQPAPADGPSPPSPPAWWHHFLGGVASGVAEGLIFCPADQAILRARLRTDSKSTVWRELFSLSDSGRRGMYRGLSLDLAGTGVRRALFPTILHTGKGLISDFTGLPSENLIVCMVAGTAAGAIDPLVTNPLGRLRTVVQAPMNTEKKLHARSAFKAVYKAEGFAGLYKGLSTNMVRGATYCTVIAASLQVLSDVLPPPESSVWNAFAGPEEWRKVASHMGAAVCAVVVVSPLDVLLVRKQQAVGGKESVFKIATQLVKQEGVRHFFIGTGFKVGMLAPRQALSLYLAGRLTDKFFGERYEADDDDV